jgi:2-methylcitrate dehydratase PrpD
MSVTETFAVWAAETPDIRAEGPLGKARDAVMDTIGVIIAGAPDKAAQSVRRAASAWGDGNSTVIGQSKRLAAPWAALANGTAAHALDFDDSFPPVAGHSSAVMVPALLALGEARGASGHAILDAYIVGLEIQARVGQSVNFEHYRRGWHSTSTVATIGTAAGCARLMGLDADGMRNAISIAVSTAAGSKRQFGSMVKPMHAGLAAKNAVMAAGLAAEGIEGNEEPLDGKWGFRELFAGEDSPGFEAALATLGDPLAIDEFGLSPKIYPCCASTHRSLDAVLSMRAANGLNAADVKEIVTVVPPMNFDNLRFSDPQSEMERRFSMQYCLATAMTNGKVALGDFRPGGETPADVGQFMAKVDMRSHDGAVTRANPAAKEATLVEMHLTNGETLSASVENQKGDGTQPLSDADYADKFLDCAADAMTPGDAVRLHGDIMGFNGLDSIGAVMDTLRDLPIGAPKAAAE